MTDIELKRINVQIPKWIIDMVDEYGKKLNMSRTSALSLILADWFKQQTAMETMSNVVDMQDMIKKIAGGPPLGKPQEGPGAGDPQSSY